MNQNIIFFHSVICPRCVRVRRILKIIKKDHPDLNIKKIGSISKFLKRELRTLPAVKIGENVIYSHDITKERILDELGLLE